MALAELLRQEYHLTNEEITRVINFAKFLESQKKPKPIGVDEDGFPIYRKASALKGKIHVPDNFDEPLETFQEYM